MTSQSQTTLKCITAACQCNRCVAGGAIILIGMLILVGQLASSDWYGLLFLPALGVIFLVWGVRSRHMGLLVPGGILSGIGLGAFLTQAPFSPLSEAAAGGAFLLSLSLGFALITVLSAFFTCGPRWWPLIPGIILALIGTAMLVSGPLQAAAQWISQIWPLGLIIFGSYLVLRRKDNSEA